MHSGMEGAFVFHLTPLETYRGHHCSLSKNGFSHNAEHPQRIHQRVPVEPMQDYGNPLLMNVSVALIKWH